MVTLWCYNDNYDDQCGYVPCRCCRCSMLLLLHMVCHYNYVIHSIWHWLINYRL